MTDRLNALTVILDREIRDDDAQPILEAIQMIKGVGQVIPHVADFEAHAAKWQATQDIKKRLWKALEGEDA